MKRLTVFCFTLIGSVYCVCAQHTKILKLNVSEKNAFVPSAKVSNIFLQQSLPDSSYIGYAQTGVLNRMAMVRTEHNITADLNGFLEKQYSANYTNEGITLLILLKELRINERTFAMKEKAYFRFAADVWGAANGKDFQYLASMDTTTMNGGMDVTASHVKNLTKALKTIIEKGLIASRSVSFDGEGLSVDAIKIKADERFTLPIYFTSSYNNGIFMNYTEFLQNAPTVADYRVEMKKKTGIHFYAKKEDSTESEIVPWGLAKNGELYKYYGGNLVPIEKMQNEFVVSSYMEERKRKNNSMFWSGIAAGVAGGIISSTISGGTVVYIPTSYNDRSPLMLTNIPAFKKDQPKASKIDFATGELYF